MEAAVAVAAGVVAGNVALLAFGIDSVIEFAAGVGGLAGFPRRAGKTHR